MQFQRQKRPASRRGAVKKLDSMYASFTVMRARCGQLPVVIGAAPASQLFSVSFADVLREEQDCGYQRPIDIHHSRQFRTYIERPGATTIPLTFNLRGPAGEGWTLEPADEGELTVLAIRLPSPGVLPVLAQVDCQHRLGMMGDSDIPLTFQCFLGLTPRDEMSIFSVINGNAKGLSSSLLDYHNTKLISDLDVVQTDLFIAKALNDDVESVWHGRVKLGGAATQGSNRRISLRGLQTATKLFLQRCPFGPSTPLSPTDKYKVVRDYWAAVATVWPTAWSQPRVHLLTKGVGVTALSLLAGDILTALVSRQQPATADTFAEYLVKLRDIDWSNTGTFKGYGGRDGANKAHQSLASRLFAPGLAVMRVGN
jgi:DNA sulfur modification protein DndB